LGNSWEAETSSGEGLFQRGRNRKDRLGYSFNSCLTKGGTKGRGHLGGPHLPRGRGKPKSCKEKRERVAAQVREQKQEAIGKGVKNSVNLGPFHGCGKSDKSAPGEVIEAIRRQKGRCRGTCSRGRIPGEASGRKRQGKRGGERKFFLIGDLSRRHRGRKRRRLTHNVE